LSPCREFKILVTYTQTSTLYQHYIPLLVLIVFICIPCTNYTSQRTSRELCIFVFPISPPCLCYVQCTMYSVLYFTVHTHSLCVITQHTAQNVFLTTTPTIQYFHTPEYHHIHPRLQHCHWQHTPLHPSLLPSTITNYTTTPYHVLLNDPHYHSNNTTTVPHTTTSS